jgi:3-oxoacyl-[acyl-carrier protein] reductase
MSMLENKIALVTGGAQGIGRAISIALASEGAHVAFSDIKINEAAEETKKLVQSKGVKAMSKTSAQRRESSMPSSKNLDVSIFW